MKKKNINIFIKSIRQTRFFVFSIKSCIVFILCMGLASLLCYFISKGTDTNSSVALIFVLAVFLTSLCTEGYFYGILASIVSVFAVNWAFTYPYWKLDFSIYGYPITFITMLTVGIATSTLTTILKKQESLRIEKEKEQIRSTLLRSISHDIRTPLTAIIGDMEMISSDSTKLDKESLRIILDAKENASWLRKMIDNVLSITRVENDPGDIKKTNETPDDLIQDLIVKFKRNYPNVKIKVNLPDEVFTMPIDVVLIEQLMLNLLDNAVIHGNANQIDIAIKRKDNYAAFTIEDNGRGIKDDYIGHLFDGSMLLMNNDKNTNMGIGLMLCKTIVEAHGGTISGENYPLGARFTFTIKLD